MNSRRSVQVHVDLAAVAENARRIALAVGVPVYAVVKADAYGLGAVRITQALTSHVAGWCVFSLDEAVAADLWRRTGKPSITLGPPQSLRADDYLQAHVRPAVSTIEEALALRAADPLLCVDTGMQRFACPPEQIDAVIRAGGIREAFTHATSLDHVRRLVELVKGRVVTLHAAASSLLDQPEARLDAVRPGLALYRDAVRISCPLIEVRKTRPPAGYSGFSAEHHGVILCGHAQGLRRGHCLINNRRSRILEVGMQSAYVETAADDRVGDEVVLLGDGLEPAELAAQWGCTPHEVLLRLASGLR